MTYNEVTWHNYCIYYLTSLPRVIKGIPVTFRSRILLTFLLLFSASFTLIILYFYQTTSAALQEETITRLRNDASWALDDLSDQLELQQTELAAMATARVWYDNSPHEYLLARLKTYKRIYPLFEHFTLYDKHGKVVADSDGSNNGSSDKCCWQEGIIGKKGFHVETVKGENDSAIHFYHGVMNLRGELTTVLTGSIPLSRLIKNLRGVDKYSNSDVAAYHVELISADGKILYSIPNTPTVGKEAAGWDLLRSEINRLNSHGIGSSSSATLNSLNILAISEQNPASTNLPWVMRIHVSKELLFAEIRNQGKMMALLSIVMLGISGFFIWIASARLSRPVRELSDLVHEIGTGNLDTIKELPGRTDEFNGLAESMRMTGSSLEAALAELNEREDSPQSID